MLPRWTVLFISNGVRPVRCNRDINAISASVHQCFAAIAVFVQTVFAHLRPSALYRRFRVASVKPIQVAEPGACDAGALKPGA